MNKKVVLRLGGDKITANEFRKGLVSFQSVLEEVAKEFTRQAHAFTWFVGVERGSINVEFQPEAREMTKALLDSYIDVFNAGLDVLQKKAERPPFFNDAALENIEILSNLPSRKEDSGITKISIVADESSHEITPYYGANVNHILEIQVRSLGSIEGELLTVSQRDGTRIVIYESLTDRAVQCYIPDEMLEQAINAFGGRVYVFGLISYGRDGRPKNIRVEELRVFPEDEDLPSAYDVCGILGD